jgi:hypothetical protein
VHDGEPALLINTMLNYPTENTYALGLMSDDREEFQKAQSEMLELARETRHHANCILMLSRIITALKVSEAKLDPEVEQEISEIMREVLIKIEGMTHLGYTNKVLYEIFAILGGAQLLNERGAGREAFSLLGEPHLDELGDARVHVAHVYLDHQ